MRLNPPAEVRPEIRDHVQNPNSETVQVKETGRNYQFEVIDGALMRGMDL